MGVEHISGVIFIYASLRRVSLFPQVKVKKRKTTLVFRRRYVGRTRVHRVTLGVTFSLQQSDYKVM